MGRGFVFILLSGFAGPAFADDCPNLWHRIDHRLESAQLSEADRTDVLEHRTRGEFQHHSGHHAESMAALNAALAKLPSGDES